MTTASCVKSNDEAFHVDPQHLFQRLTCVTNGLDEDTSDVFRFELCTHPSSLFEPSGVMREPQKSGLADFIWNIGDCGGALEIPLTGVTHVLDGRSLLHRIPWSNGIPFSSICSAYGEYVTK